MWTRVQDHICQCLKLLCKQLHILKYCFSYLIGVYYASSYSYKFLIKSHVYNGGRTKLGGTWCIWTGRGQITCSNGCNHWSGPLYWTTGHTFWLQNVHAPHSNDNRCFELLNWVLIARKRVAWEHDLPGMCITTHWLLNCLKYALVFALVFDCGEACSSSEIIFEYSLRSKVSLVIRPVPKSGPMQVRNCAEDECLYPVTMLRKASYYSDWCSETQWA